MKVVSTLVKSIMMVMLCSVMPIQAAEQSKRFDIYEMSDILCDRGYYTLLPKRCVVFVPQGFEHKMKRSKGSKYVLFNHFIMKNYVWVHKLEVTLAQAEGKVAIAEDKMERLKKTGKVIIAVHRGRPVTLQKTKTVNLTNLDK